MRIPFKFILTLLIGNLFFAIDCGASEKTQAWGARMGDTKSATMRNRNKNARVWMGEQARGWGVGSRMNSALTTSMNFHVKSAVQALSNTQSNANQASSFSASACGTCTTLQNIGDNFVISSSSLSSVNSASVTSHAAFNN